jgi:EAL domain-containing protein (putative c-di-GMP-specific phosphodiesterase class I)/GGDEF domain-containing protein
MLTGAGSEEVAVRAVRAGVYDYLRKEKLDKEQLKKAILNAYEEHKEEQQRLSELTNQSQAFNKALFYQKLESADNEDGKDRVLLVVELDDAHTLEERVGAILRDNIVRHVAHRSFEVFQVGECHPHITRLGDAAVALLIDKPGSAKTLEFNMEGLCAHLKKRPYKFDDKKFRFTVSIGVVEVPRSRRSAERLIEQARRAVEIAGRARDRNSFHIFQPDVDAPGEAGAPEVAPEALPAFHTGPAGAPAPGSVPEEIGEPESLPARGTEAPASARSHAEPAAKPAPVSVPSLEPAEAPAIPSAEPPAATTPELTLEAERPAPFPAARPAATPSPKEPAATPPVRPKAPSPAPAPVAAPKPPASAAKMPPAPGRKTAPAPPVKPAPTKPGKPVQAAVKPEQTSVAQARKTVPAASAQVAAKPAPKPASDEIQLDESTLGEEARKIRQAFTEKRIVQTFQPVMPLFNEEGVEAPEVYRVHLQLIDRDGNAKTEDYIYAEANTPDFQKFIDRWLLRETIGRVVNNPKSDHVFVIRISEASLADPALFNWLRKLLGGLDKQRPGKSIALEMTASEFQNQQKKASALVAYLGKSQGFRFALAQFAQPDDLRSLAGDQQGIDLLRVGHEMLHKLKATPAAAGTTGSLLDNLVGKGMQVIVDDIQDATTLTNVISTGAHFAMGNFIGEPMQHIDDSTNVQTFEIT